MKLSVIILCYNFQDYIETCLLSVLNQKTNFDFEILVCNDNSTDNSKTCIENIAKNNPKIKLYNNEKNVGPQISYKRLLDVAKGQYIAYLDGDDYWTDPNTFQYQIDFLDSNPDYFMCFTGYYEKLKNGFFDLNNDLNLFKTNGGIPKDDNDYTEKLIYDNVVHFSKIYRNDKRFFKNYFYELSILDWPINFEISLLGKIKYFNYPSGVHRLHDNNIMAKIANDNLVEKKNYKDIYIKIFKKRYQEYKLNKKIKILFLAPHLSTGGMPAYLLKIIQSLKEYSNEYEMFVAEYSTYSMDYVTHRNKIIDLIPKNNFYELNDDKFKLIQILKDNEIDILHVHEILEGFDYHNQVPFELLSQIYSNDRTWKVVETCHNIFFNPLELKKYSPDAYAFCTPYHPKVQFSNEKSYYDIFEFPIEDKIPSKELKEKTINELNFDKEKIHILNVGLWTSGKNQGEGVEIARYLERTNPELHFHFVGNQAPNFENYWKPIMDNLPSNVTVWGERNDVDKFMIASDLFMFNSTWECNPIVLREAISYGLKIVARNLPQYLDMFNPYINNITDSVLNNSNLILELINKNINYKLPNNGEKEFALKFASFYEKINNNPIKKQEIKNNKIEIIQNFIVNPFLEIKGNVNNDNDYLVEFFDEKNNLIYNNKIKVNHWVKLNRQYYTKWMVKVWENDKLIYSNTLNLENKRVYISFASSSLGDTLAWFPYVEEFGKKHNCELIVSTFHNNLFKDQYENITFVQPGSTVQNIYAQYNIGLFYKDFEFDSSKHPSNPIKLPLMQYASDILGLEFKEIKPKLPSFGEKKYKRVCIAIHSTAQAKYWNNPTGWQEVVDYLIKQGYEVRLLSKEENGYMGNFEPKGMVKQPSGSLESLIKVIQESEFFIGISSGLSWLAWASGIPVVLISGFTDDYLEPKQNVIRIINKNVCNSCWHNHKFDPGDWNWCPIHKNTNRQFECSKSITGKMVIEKLNELI